MQSYQQCSLSVSVWHVLTFFFCHSAEAMDKLNNSVKVKDVDPNDFVALFIPGGHGEQALLPLHPCTGHVLVHSTSGSFSQPE